MGQLSGFYAFRVECLVTVGVMLPCLPSTNWGNCGDWLYGIFKSLYTLFPEAQIVTTDFDPAIATNPKPVDLRGIPCPLSFVRAKLQIEKIAAGEQLEIWLDGGEPIEQVPNSLTVDGHIVRSVEPKDGYFALVVEKAQLEA